MHRLFGIVILTITVALLTVSRPRGACAGDWPQWRYDAGRGAATPDSLPEKLHLQWVRELPSPRPAWPASQPWLRFDDSYTPVAAGKSLFVPSMVTDSVTAYDTESGALQWRFFADGPVRLAPIADDGKVYFGSDDGFLYCLNASDGALLWKFRGGPTDRKVLGNERLISTWPVRGGPVLIDGTVYFTAGIWPYMGIFVHAVDAETGKAVWTNSGAASEYTTQPHSSPAFGAFVPRGHLAATGDLLIAPGGRTQPGCYDRKTGAFRRFDFGDKNTGSYRVATAGKWFYTSEGIMRATDGTRINGKIPAVHDNTALYGFVDGQLVAQAPEIKVRTIEKTDKEGKKQQVKQLHVEGLWSMSVPGAPGRLFLKAGSQFVLGAKDAVTIVRHNPKTRQAEPIFQGTFRGQPWSMLAADDKLFVITTAGTIYCFGEEVTTPTAYKAPIADAVPANPWQQHAAAILAAAGGAPNGYALVFGLGTGGLAEALATESNLHLIAVDPDAKKIGAWRRRMTSLGLYGTRVAAQVGSPADCSLPPYMAELIVSEDSLAMGADRGPAFLKPLFEALRPYGGAACLPIPADVLSGMVDSLQLPNARVKPAGKDWSVLIREGALPGTGDWTHNYADPGNSIVSMDRRVKAPLGLLWFGGPPNDEVLPRHGHGPSPQVAAGRLFIEGPNMLRAIDIYTGRLLWQQTLPGLGKYYENTGHQPGAGEIGSNYVSLPDAVYVVRGREILELAADTGELKKQFGSAGESNGAKPYIGGIVAWDDLLVATTGPVEVRKSGDSKRATVPNLTPLIEPNETWHYLAGSDPDGNWTAPGFDAAAWKTGEAGFGYGDDDDRTVLDDMQKSYTRVYIRKAFDAQAARDAKELILSINYDDGFIAYLNGTEVARSSIPKGRGKEAGQAESHEAERHEAFSIKGAGELLREGQNVLAIEGHNTTPDSSDFTLDPRLLFRAADKANGTNGRPVVRPLPARQFKAVQYASTSRRLCVFDRNSGKELWSRDATYGFRHNNIAVGADTLFCIDGLSEAQRSKLARRGKDPSGYQPRLLALDVRTGEETWSTGEHVFGTFLSYSAEHDVLLQAGSAHRDRAEDEAKTGMVAYQGKDGTVLWRDLQRKYDGPCLLHGDTIICQGPAYSLLTGEPKTRKHPLTDATLPWSFTRNYGCNTVVGSQNLLTFRSAAAGFYDLANDGGTGNFGGFKSSCTSNLIIAGGLLNAPEYTRTCTCRYQNQTSLAMVHDPDVEVWTFNAFSWDGKPVRRVGINFGAPGDRRADDGTLWLDYPSRGGPSPDLPLKLEPSDAKYFRKHSSEVRGDAIRGELKWVAASGVRGVRDVTLTLAKNQIKPRRYTVRLHFVETDSDGGTFDVVLQGKKVLEGLTLGKQSAPTALVEQFDGIEVTDTLQVTLVPSDPDRSVGTVLCGIEVVAED